MLATVFFASLCLAQPAPFSLSSGGTPILNGVSFVANTSDGLAFATTSAVLDDAGRVTFTLAGPDAGNASVSALYSRLPRGYALDWTIRYSGPERAWNPWTTGFQFDYAQAITGARTLPVTKWVAPTGAHPWEVPSDTPYPDTECQLREVFFGDTALVMVSSTYDADWLYGNDPARARFSRFPLPKETPCELHTRMTLLVVPATDLDPARLAAEAARRPLALSLTTGRLGNLFTPGEPLAFDATISNVTHREQPCTLTLQTFSYQGRELCNLRTSLILDPLATQTQRQTLACPERGVVFVAAKLTWQGGEQIQRMTLGILPQRKGGGQRPSSPFAMGAIIANPTVYPDQPEMPAVLDLMERIGVRWVRSGWFPFKLDMTDQDDADIRVRADLLRRRGILPYQQTPVPDTDDRAALQRFISNWLARLGGVAPVVEVGNELNYSMKAGEYVENVLRPVSEAMRRVAPDCKVLSMGLGGVTQDWLGEFVKAGGMDLIDVLSIHPGCHPRAPEFWEGWRGWVFRSQVLDALRACREHGGKDVWITEAYAPTPPGRWGLDLRTSADYLVRTYVCSLALGVKVVAWYQFQDGVWFAQRPNPDDVEYNFGVVYTDLSPKPAYVAYGTMTEQLEGAVCRGRLDLGADDLYGVRFEREGQPVDVLWSYREKHETDLPWWPPENYKDNSRKPGEPWVERWRKPVEVTLPAAGEVVLTDIMGNPRSLAPAEGKVTLSLTGSPVYITGLGDVPLLPRFWEDIP